MLALAASTALLVGGTVSRAERTRDRWGATSPVVVASGPVEAGEAVAGSLVLEQWPRELVPEDAASDMGSIAPDATAAVAIRTGTPIFEGLLASAPSSPQALVAISTTGLAAVPPLSKRDRVTLWVTGDPDDASSSPSSRPLTTEAVVTHVSDDVVTVSVPEHDVAAVIGAAALATVTIVATPP